MKVKKIIGVFLIILSILFTTPVFAATINDSTAIISNPKMELLVPVETKTYSLTSDYATITGAHSYVYFYDRTNLSSSFASSNDRILEVSLFENDTANDDDLVKLYTYHFVGRLMDGVEISTYSTGNIDSSGDPTGEFYLRFFLHAVPEDDNYGTLSNVFFKYQIAVS